MEKRDMLVLVVFLLVAIGAVAVMYYSDAVGQAWFQKQIMQKPIMPSPKAAPPSPTPIPAPRIMTTESAKKPEFPSEALYYLKPGKYTTPTDEIKQIKIKPISIGGAKPGRKVKPWEQNILEFNQIRGIFKYMDEFPTYKKDDDNSWDLTVNDIFNKGLNKNYCGQYARLFITLARAQGIPAVYVATYYKDWADEQKQKGCWDGKTKGHVYAKVFVDGNWHGVNPQLRTFVDLEDTGNFIEYFGDTKKIAIPTGEGRDHGDIVPHINRWCLEGLRYHKAISPLLLCPNIKTFDYYWDKIRTGKISIKDLLKINSQNIFQGDLMMMMACKEPLQTVEWQKKSQR